MLFKSKKFSTGLLVVGLTAIVVTGCTNRPTADRWKYTSSVAKLEAKPVDYIYVPIVEPDGSLEKNELRKLERFFNETGLKRGDKILVQTSSTYLGEAAGEWVADWLDIHKVSNNLQIGSLDLGSNTDPDMLEEDKPLIQVVVRRYKLNLPHCKENMAGDISTVSSITKKVHGCVNQANLAHMIADPSHLALGSDPGAVDGAMAARGVNDYWKGETKPLLLDQFEVTSEGGS